METIKHFDRVKINSLLDPKILKSELPMEELKRNSYSCEIQKAGYKSHLNGYSSRLVFSAPNARFLKILYGHEKSLGTYFISHLEIAEDTIYPSKAEALQATYNFSCRKKWATKNWVYVSKDIPRNDNKFGLQTDYTENKLYGHKTYGRNSKITGQPCFHREWHFFELHTILDKTGISEIGDLIGFNFPSFFRLHDAKYLIRDERADQQKVGKWALGWSQRKNFSKREVWRIGCTGSAIIGGLDAAQFVQKLKNYKIEIRSRKGELSEWDKRVLGIRDYRKFMT